MNPESNNKPAEPIVQAQQPIPPETKLDINVTVPSETHETDKDINWKKFKEAREKERKDAEAMALRAKEKEAEAEALKAALDALVSKPALQSQQSNDEEETEDQRITKRVDALLAQREAEMERRRAERDQQELPNRIQNAIPDFHQVMTAENIDYLSYHYPEIANTFKKLPDTLENWSDMYKAVKRFVPNVDRKKDVAKAENNLNKPQSASRAGVSQPGQQTNSPNILTEDRKQANWERMQRAMKGLS